MPAARRSPDAEPPLEIGNGGLEGRSGVDEVVDAGDQVPVAE
jgi:hypothetical protein